MGIDLKGTDRFGMPRYERINTVGWHACMKLGEGHGWKPEEPASTYLRNVGHKVTDTDAKSLGKALPRALESDDAMRASFATMSAAHRAFLEEQLASLGPLAYDSELKVHPIIGFDDYRTAVERIAVYSLGGSFEFGERRRPMRECAHEQQTTAETDMDDDVSTMKRSANGQFDACPICGKNDGFQRAELLAAGGDFATADGKPNRAFWYQCNTHEMQWLVMRRPEGDVLTDLLRPGYRVTMD